MILRSYPPSSSSSARARPGRGPQTPLFGWLSLDEDDSDPARFWSYFMAALETCLPGVGSPTRRQLEARQPPPIRAILSALLNELALVQSNISLAPDDYQRVTDLSVHDGLAFLRAACHLRFISSSPPAPTPRLGSAACAFATC
jgi:LuxR family maltose regulon positive regulatory protein